MLMRNKLCPSFWFSRSNGRENHQFTQRLISLFVAGAIMKKSRVDDNLPGEGTSPTPFGFIAVVVVVDAVVTDFCDFRLAILSVFCQGLSIGLVVGTAVSLSLSLRWTPPWESCRASRSKSTAEKWREHTRECWEGLKSFLPQATTQAAVRARSRRGKRKKLRPRPSSVRLWQPAKQHWGILTHRLIAPDLSNCVVCVWVRVSVRSRVDPGSAFLFYCISFPSSPPPRPLSPISPPLPSPSPPSALSSLSLSLPHTRTHARALAASKSGHQCRWCARAFVRLLRPGHSQEANTQHTHAYTASAEFALPFTALLAATAAALFTLPPSRFCCLSLFIPIALSRPILALQRWLITASNVPQYAMSPA